MMARLPKYRSFLAIAVTAAACACADRRAVRPPPEALQVLFYGCSEVTTAGTCRVPRTGGAKLTVWVAGEASDSLAVRVGQRAAAVKPVEVDDGVRFSIDIPRPPTDLTVVRDQAVWRLAIRRDRVDQRLTDAEALRKRGQFTSATAAIAPFLDDPHVENRVTATSIQARIALAEGDRDSAERLFVQSISERRTHGLIWGEMRDRYALSFIKLNRGRYAESDRVLNGIATIAHHYPTGAKRAAYYRGLLAHEVGDYRRSLAETERSMQHSERLDVSVMWLAASGIRLRILIWLGRRAEARALLDALEHRIPASPLCQRAPFLATQSRDRFVLSESRTDTVRALEMMRASVKLQRKDCPDPLRLAGALPVMGQMHLALGDVDAARAALRDGRQAHPHPRAPALFRQQHLEAEIALYTGNLVRAAAAFARLQRLGEALGRRDEQRLGLIGRGRTLEALGQIDQAIRQYQRAEAIIDDTASFVPLGSGRALFLGRKTESTERLVDLLIRAGRPRDALVVARRSRTRSAAWLQWSVRLEAASDDVRRQWYEAVADIRAERRGREDDAIEEWKLSVSAATRLQKARVAREKAIRERLDHALAALGSRVPMTGERQALRPAHDELIALYHPIPTGWALFVLDDDRLSVTRLPRATHGARLLAPMVGALRTSRTVRFLLSGSLAEVDMHALPFDGRPLQASVAVSYGLDMPHVSDRTVMPERALIVAPHNDLLRTHREANLAARQLERVGRTVTRLHGMNATSTAIQHALSSHVSLFHYAGHARYLGLDGWESYLGRENQRLLTIGDIVMLSNAPKEVVLTGCETAEASSPNGTPGLSLAQAFVIAGSKSVIAAVRPIKDRDGHLIARALYDARGRRPNAPGPELLHEAQKDLLKRRVDADWAAFRALVR